MTVGQLKVLYSWIPWSEYLNAILAPLTITDDEVVMIKSLSYPRRLRRLINKTPKRVVANYMFWSVVQAELTSWEYMSKRISAIPWSSSEEETRQPRWKECVDLTSTKLGLITSALYVRQYFDEDSKNRAAEMLGYIRRQFSKILEKVHFIYIILRKDIRYLIDDQGSLFENDIFECNLK